MKIPAPPPEPTLDAFDGDAQAMAKAFGVVNVATDPYLPWEKLRWKSPPAGLTAEQWWFIVRLHRQSIRRPLPLRQLDGTPFTYALPDDVLRRVEDVARRAGGHIGMNEAVTNPASRDRYLISGLMEEAITSSQLEGATTTRRVAREMLRAGRKPRTHSEQMIWNNYRAMEFVRAHRHDDITPSMVLELHTIVTHATLEDEADAGRLQRPQDERIEVGTIEGTLLHRPPPAEELPQRLIELCAFANGSADADGPWLSPVVRAILVHFMVGHDHSFVDGNGRLARALFYWVMLKHGLWLTEFITISTILAQAPVQYAHAYLNSEYEGDTTYFLVYQLTVLVRAFDALERYLADKVVETERMRRRMRGRSQKLNHRQLALLEAAVADPHQDFTLASHGTSHGVVLETARRDLMDLEDRGLLVRRKIGRAFHWSAAPNLNDLL